MFLSVIEDRTTHLKPQTVKLNQDWYIDSFIFKRIITQCLEHWAVLETLDTSRSKSQPTQLFTAIIYLYKN